MQISRHWRLQAQRYRLEGVRYATGELSIQSRPRPEASVADGVLLRSIAGSKEVDISHGVEQEKVA